MADSPTSSPTTGSSTSASTGFFSRLAARLLGVAVLAVTVAGCGGPNLVDRITSPRWGFCGTLVIILDIVALVDVIGDDMRSTSNKVIWSLLIVFMPILGVLLYFFFGKE